MPKDESPTANAERRGTIHFRCKETPCDIEISSVFHRIWTSQVGTQGYKKKDYQELSRMLYRRGIIV